MYPFSRIAWCFHHFPFSFVYTRFYENVAHEKGNRKPSYANANTIMKRMHTKTYFVYSFGRIVSTFHWPLTMAFRSFNELYTTTCDINEFFVDSEKLMNSGREKGLRSSVRWKIILCETYYFVETLMKKID